MVLSRDERVRSSAAMEPAKSRGIEHRKCGHGAGTPGHILCPLGHQLSVNARLVAVVHSTIPRSCSSRIE